MADVVVFGVQDLAVLARFYLTHDSPHRVVAFCVDEAYVPADGQLDGLPVVSFAAIETEFPAETVSFLAPLSHRRMNRLRETVYQKIKAKGYPFISYVSSKATTFPGTPIGENCFILEDNTIQPFTAIGDNVVLWSGNHIGHHSTIGDHVFVTSHVVISGHCTVEPYAFLGVNATVRDGIRIAEGSLVAMAAAITRDTEPWGVYMGSPARKGERFSHELDV